MNLASYLAENHMTDAAFAAAIQVDRSVVTKLRSGRLKPSLETAGRIAKATNGAVPMESFLSSAQVTQDGTRIDRATGESLPR